MSKRISKLANQYSVIAFIFLLTSVFIIFFYSISTSPLYAEVLGTDSSVYQIVAKYWNFEKKPYTDFVDHKGILIYTIDKVGYLLTGDKKGIFILQVINLIIISFGYFKISEIFVKTPGRALIVTLIGLGFYAFGFTSIAGNSVEEWFMPFAVLSVYLQCMYFDKVEIEKKHPPKYALFYGISFAVGLFTVLRNVMVLCVAVLCIVMILIINREWSNLLRNSIMFVTGVLVVLIPVQLFLISMGISKEAWMYSLLFNFKYVGINFGTPLDKQYTLKTFFLFFLNWYGVFSALIAGVLAMLLKQKEKGVSYIFCSAFFLAFLLRTNAFGSYAIPAAPYIVVMIGEFIRFTNKERLNRILLCVLAVCSFCVGIYPLYSINARKEQGVLYKCNECPVLKNISEEDKDDVILVACEPGIYLKYDIKPASRWFIMQNIFRMADPETEKQIVTDYDNNEIKWLVVYGNSDNSFLRGLLNRKYTMVDEEAGYSLFVLTALTRNHPE